MPEKDAANYKFDVLDITKVWPHSDYPLHKVGKMTLNRNPENYHAETEQSAFSPSHLVPGIEPSNDKMLQGRLFSPPSLSLEMIDIIHGMPGTHAWKITVQLIMSTSLNLMKQG